MKKLVLIIVVILLAFLLIGAQAPPAKPEDLAKNLVFIEKPEAVPGPMKDGFETMVAKGSKENPPGSNPYSYLRLFTGSAEAARTE